MNIYIFIWIIVTLIPSLICLFLLINEHKKNRRLQKEVESIKWTDQHQTPDWAIKEGTNLIHSASKQANTIISEAELEAIKIAAQSKIATKSFEQESQKQLAQFLTEAQAKYQKFLENLEGESVNSQKDIEEMMRTRINEVLLKFDQNLSEFLGSSEQKSLEALNLELRSARQLIDSYKQQQLAIIDENIVAVLERTLSLVLKKKLSLDDQMDLVFEGLEKAKVEKFFA